MNKEILVLIFLTSITLAYSLNYQERLVKDLFENLNLKTSQDPDYWMKYLDNDITFRQMIFPRPIVDKNLREVIRTVSTYFKSTNKAFIKIMEIYSARNKVIVDFEFKGNYKNGRMFAFAVVSIIKFNMDNKMTEMSCYSDFGNFLRSLE